MQLSSKGCSVDKVAVNADVASGRPVLVAAKDINAGETVMQISDSAWISPEALKQHPLGAKLAGLDGWLQVALVLLAEKFGSGGGNKVWASYVQSLPNSVGSPLFWSDEDLQLIQGTQLLSSTGMYKKFFMSQFEELQEQLFSREPAAFPASVFTPDNFLYAAAAVRSRVHAPLDGEKLALVPLADVVSHSRNANVVWQSKSAGFLGRGQTLSVEAIRPLKKGEALKTDFAPEKLDNDVLLDYGVVDGANFQGGYTLTLSLNENDPNRDDKLDILEQAGLGGTATFTLTADKDPPSDMLAFLRLDALSGADTFLLESVLRQEAWSYMNQPVTQENERAICKAIAEGANAALFDYGTTIDQDLVMLRSGKVQRGSNLEAALLVRLGEQEALDSAARFFEQRETLLPTLEYYQERRLKRLGLMDDRGNTTYDGFLEKGIA